ncbi:NUDIX domain protein [mine drainage metagenome]|uniref:NUDIX domain protein n=1 Tax=mine drainage metagenome TaxID=410659 RepID=A0A1J5T023_9ZZZZ
MTRIFQYKRHDSLMVAVDCIIFGFDGKEIKALLVKRGFEPEMGKWSLMGGFVKGDESVDAAANRILDQLTGLTSVYMEQLYCFGDVNRDPGGRVVSVAYFALIKIDDYSEELMKQHNAKWFSLNRIPSLVFDHKQMIKIAKSRLRQKVSRQPIGFALLPDKFTLQQLQALYEAIYETVFDKRNFTKKILSLGVLEKLKEKDKETSKKGSFYYVFIREKYSSFAKENFKFI